MTYPSPLIVSARKLSPDVVVAVSGFKRFGKVNFGARMALFNINNTIVAWSAIPYGPGVADALELLTGSRENTVSHFIVPDREHTMAAASFRKQFPNLKVLAMAGVAGLNPDYEVSAEHANQTIGAAALAQLGVTDPAILANFEFVFLPSHGNQELVTYHKPSRTVFEADLLFNLRADEPMEQFLPATGFPASYRPFTGWSFIARFLNPDLALGRAMFRMLVKPQQAKGGLQAIYAWDFDSLVMCHGNIIETGGKAQFAKVFGLVLD